MFFKMAAQDHTKTVSITFCFTRTIKNDLPKLLFSASGQLIEDFVHWTPYVGKNDYLLAINDQGACDLSSEQIQNIIGAAYLGEFVSVVFVKKNHFNPVIHEIGQTKSKSKVRQSFTNISIFYIYTIHTCAVQILINIIIYS